MQTVFSNDETARASQPRKANASEVDASLLQQNTPPAEICAQSWGTSSVYEHIAYSLALAYTDLFYVNMETFEFAEYQTDDERGVLVEVRRAAGFFESCKHEAKLFVHPDDQDAFISAMNRDFLATTLSQSKKFDMTYRRIKNGRTFYVQMEVSRMRNDDQFIVIAVSDIDELVARRRAEERMREERATYARLHALTGNFIVIYVVDPQTSRYRELGSAEEYEKTFLLAKSGEDYFGTARELAKQYVYPEDLDRFLTVFTKTNVMAEIERSGIFTLGFRLVVATRPIHVKVRAAMVQEKEGLRLIVGINDIDAQVKQEQAVERRLAQAQYQANIDALTGVKNKHAYLEMEARLDGQIAEQCVQPFAVAMLDVNDLKKINDTAGHQAGDKYLCDACKVVCNVFKHSPVFRVGGDEFAVIAQGTDYKHLEERLGELRNHNAEAMRSGGIVIACGAAEFEDDACVATVFERADRSMYENKNKLKSGVLQRAKA